MPRSRWDDLVRGRDCPLCTELTSGNQPNEHGYPVATLSLSRLRLARNQSMAGYCVLICTEHVCEPYELRADQQRSYFDDLLRVGRALERAFRPIKLNYQILGNLVPHLHAHVQPRYYGDPAPGRPLDPSHRVVLLTDDEYQQRAQAIRDALHQS
jgi:diadenosine tetraphosphate (Ap4A) HIT family hydrolase